MRVLSFVLLFFGAFLLFFAGSFIVRADVLSINSGGDENLAITPDEYIEGFFTGDNVVVLSVCGNGILETPYEQCDDGNTVSGDGCSSTCTTEGGGGEEGGGGGGGDVTPTALITVIPSEINLNLAVNTNRQQIITVTNRGTNTTTIIVTQSNLNGMVLIPESSFQLGPGETKELNVIFVASDNTGIFTGRLIIGGRTVLVTLNIQTKLLLFDSNIIVLNKDYIVPQGENLRTSVTLIPLGDKERLDVTLNYAIKDYDGKVYLTRTETVLVEEQVNFRRNFDTGILPLGEYIVGLELIYPNGVAPSSAHFEVVSGKPTTLFGKVVFYLVNAILIVAILIIIVIIIRLLKLIKMNEEYNKSKLGEKRQ